MAVLYKTIDEYIKAFTPEIQSILEKIRRTIHAVAPQATEVISYGMPAFKMDKVLVYFAAYTNHIGFYPTGSGIEAFKQELAGYKFSKGAIRFPLDKPVPYELITKITKFRAEQATNDR
jgi:uncharacterized protein YdhG (YjbR/CyaY superfamily)